MEVVLLLADPDEGGVAGGEQAAAALADGWGAAEAACPHLTVTLVRGASKLSFDALAGSLMQRLVAQPALDVSLQVEGVVRPGLQMPQQPRLPARLPAHCRRLWLVSPHLRPLPARPALQFKHPLVGSIRALALRCTAEVRPLAQAVQHAALCPCHHAPAAAASAAAACTCAISGAPLDRRQCGRDERTVQVGGHPGGALHLLAPFDIGTAGGGGAAAPLSVVARVKVGGGAWGGAAAPCEGRGSSAPGALQPAAANQHPSPVLRAAGRPGQPSAAVWRAAAAGAGAGAAARHGGVGWGRG